VGEPFQVTDVARPVEAELVSELGQGVRRGALAQYRARYVAGQDFRCSEDQDADGKQSQQAEDDPNRNRS